MEARYRPSAGRQPQTDDNATLEDVVRLAGVTAMTVSPTLKRPERLREATC